MRLAQRIEALAPRSIAHMPPEQWIVDGEAAYQLDKPDQVITRAELALRRPSRIERVIIDPV